MKSADRRTIAFLIVLNLHLMDIVRAVGIACLPIERETLIYSRYVLSFSLRSLYINVSKLILNFSRQKCSYASKGNV